MLKKPPDFGGLTHKIRKIAFSCFRCPVFAFLVSRIIGYPARPCLICQQDAHLCARGKHHTLDLLLDEIARRIECYERERCN